MNNEWGNISLPGLSDEELFNTNWNRVAAGLQNKNNKKLLDLAKFKKHNTEFSEKMSNVSARRGQEYQQLFEQGMAQRDNSYQAINNSKPEVRQRISASMKGRIKSVEHHNRIAEKNRSRSKPIQTPWGRFESRKAAVEHAAGLGIANASKKMDKWLRLQPTEYYYITPLTE
ncbi:hypothetical protein UFOVP849_17 [uncultured Caudovirales phage]|uniref:Uncharacterized protein n=1 Tax=uncultured Caudovirales phage TaxID=2100421 RepID=A0A6J5PAA9_9CAUD|nr:hypothetical protein UFOVP849_17 [uncultured Caudovirales phage]